jgi:hypothetical protein
LASSTPPTAWQRYNRKNPASSNSFGAPSNAINKAQNETALTAPEDGGHIFAAYEHPEHPNWKIWIITESDRSCTTILFPAEY